MTEKRAIIRTENLMKTYGTGGTFVNAVNRLSISVYEREFTAIVGPSGSGKSTLLHLMGGLDIPSGGNIYVYESTKPNVAPGTVPEPDDTHPVNLPKLSRNALAKYRGENFGFVFQNYALLPVLTAWENVMMPSVYTKVKFDEGYALSLFERLGVSDRLHHLPSEMSGGEQQRVAMIRALMTHPRILFADEPTGNLDRANSAEILRLLHETAKYENCTVILVTHDESAAANADRIITMKDGSVDRIV